MKYEKASYTTERRCLQETSRASAKRYATFQSIRASLCSSESDSLHLVSSATSIKPLCPTRWTVRADSMQSVLNNYSAIMLTLDTVSSTVKSQSGSKAAGLYRSFHRFSTYFGLKLGISVFDRAEKLSKLLQSEHLTATAAKDAALTLVSSLRASRSDKQFDIFWTEITAEAKTLDVDDPILPRRTRPSVRIDSGSEGVIYERPMDYFRAIYYEFLDSAINCISSRFQQNAFETYANAEQFILDAINCKDAEPPEFTIRLSKLMQHFSTDIKMVAN